MSSAALGLVIAAAIVHVAWNALAKRAGDPFVFVWAAVGLAALAMLPVALWVGPGAELSLATLWPIAASSVIHALYFYTLGRAYELGDLSVVYPIARGLAVAAVAVGGRALLHERVSVIGGAGIACVIAGVLTVGAGRAPRGAIVWAIATGGLVACYSLIDKQGVVALHPVFYVVAMGLGSTALLVPALVRRRAVLVQLWHGERRCVLCAMSMSLTAYLLVLFAFTLSKAAYVVAARELSIVFSVVAGRILLGEAAGARRLVAAGAIAVGVALMAAA